MTARLDLLAHGASTATRAARFPDDEALEPSAVGALEVLRGRVRSYVRVLTSPARASRETAAALGFDAEVEMALSDWDYGRWRGLASKDVAEREPEAFAVWLGDSGAAPHGGELVTALMERTRAWLTQSLAREGATLAITHASVVRAAIVNALGAGPSSFARIDIAPLSLVRLSGHGHRWNSWRSVLWETCCKRRLSRPAQLLRRKSPVDHEFRAGGEGGFVAGEEEDGVRDLVSRAHPAHRRGAFEARADALRVSRLAIPSSTIGVSANEGCTEFTRICGRRGRNEARPIW